MVEHVPDYLGIALSRWLGTHAALQWCRQIALEVHIAWEWTANGELALMLDPDACGQSLANYVMKGDSSKLLDVVDCLLYRLMADTKRTRDRQGVARVKDMARELDEILVGGGSAWRVTSASDGLERRVDEVVRDVVDAARSTAQAALLTSAAEHLKNAWHEVYGRSPNPATGYREAVMAVESAARPVISPKNDNATLGTMIRDMQHKPSKWRFVLRDPNGSGDVEPVIDLMERLWQGEVRHGGTPTPTVVAAEAEAALHAAAALVHWFASGAVSLVP